MQYWDYITFYLSGTLEQQKFLKELHRKSNSKKCNLSFLQSFPYISLFPLNHIYLETLLSGQGKLLTNILFYDAFFPNSGLKLIATHFSLTRSRKCLDPAHCLGLTEVAVKHINCVCEGDGYICLQKCQAIIAGTLG